MLAAMAALAMMLAVDALAQPPATVAAAPVATKPATPAAARPLRRPTSPPKAPETAAAPTVSGSAQLGAFVDGVVREAMAEDHIAGVAVSVVEGGQIVLAKGYGAARVSPWRPVDPATTLFRLGDLSQSLTWIVILQQAAAGHMRLDGPVNLYLPEALRIPDRNGFRPVRVADILAGESGFEDRALGQAYERDPSRIRPLQTYLREERPLRVREPGSLLAQTDYAAALAGAAAAEVAGKPFETLVEQTVTGPLGLRHTSFREPHPDRAGLPAALPASLARDLSEEYRWSRTGLRLRPFAFIGQRAPSGSASASAVDMGRVMAMLLAGGTLDGVRVLSPVDVARLTGPGALFTARSLPGGLKGLELDGETLSSRAAMTLAPSADLGVFVAVNTDSGRPLAQDLADRIVEQLHAGAGGAPAPGDGLLQARGDLDGPWISDRRAFGGLEGFVDRFRRMAWARVLDDHRLLWVQPSQTSRWAVEAGGPPLRLHDLDGPSELVFAQAGRRGVFIFPSRQEAFERPGAIDRPEVFITLAGLTVILSLVALADFPVRLRQTFRESQGQRQAAVIQVTQAALWLVAGALMLVVTSQGRDPAALMYRWPGIPLVIASSCALVAGVLLLPVLLLMPPVWRGGRRVESWTAGRKLAFTFTTLVFLAFTILLGLSGALQPWSA